MIQESRIRHHRGGFPGPGGWVLYWMQQSQRVKCNHALEYAVRRANEAGLPLVVYFGVTGSFPGANLRHYTFMFQGLREIVHQCRERGITCTISAGDPVAGALALSRQAALTVLDRGYLAVQREWRAGFIRESDCPVVEVESDCIVPVETALGKEAYSAAVLRKRILPLLGGYLVPLQETGIAVRKKIPGIVPATEKILSDIFEKLAINRSIPVSLKFSGGYTEARKRLDNFLLQKCSRYAEDRSDPSLGCVSGLSPYLHFGQVSPLEIALAVMKYPSSGSEAFLEELIVRRELAANFCWYNSSYESLHGLPSWARETLGVHEADPRPAVYSLAELERGETLDPHWNAAQAELIRTGFMHGYMRMYWGKKIIEWSPTVMEAWDRAVYLNNTYQLDGRDMNSWAGIAWCFGKHDRPWQRRAVFGSVRYMNDRGLERKFNMKEYHRITGLLKISVDSFLVSERAWETW